MPEPLSAPSVTYVCGQCGAHLDGLGITHSCAAEVVRLRAVLRDLVSAYMAGEDLAPVVKRAEDLSGGQQNGS